MNCLFQTKLQAERDKVHCMEKAALQKDEELDQCKVYAYNTDFPHKCVHSTCVYKLQADTPTMCCVIFAATALHCVCVRLY